MGEPLSRLIRSSFIDFPENKSKCLSYSSLSYIFKVLSKEHEYGNRCFYYDNSLYSMFKCGYSACPFATEDETIEMHEYLLSLEEDDP